MNIPTLGACLALIKNALKPIDDDVKHINNSIQYGKIEFSATGSAEHLTQTVTFDTPFENTPVVIASLSDPNRGSLTGAPKTAVGIESVSKTQTGIGIKTASIASGTLTVYWVAIGI